MLPDADVAVAIDRIRRRARFEEKLDHYTAGTREAVPEPESDPQGSPTTASG
jgi:hypothetical protein